LAHASPDKLLLGMTRSESIYASVPHLAPLMVPWLKLSDQAGEAAGALGAMAPQSAFAVAELFQVAEHGVAGDPPNFQTRVVYPPGHNAQQLNRGKALRALGKIGVTNEAVFHAFSKALGEGETILQCDAADGIRELGPKALPLL